ncbi:MAG: AAA family ATPase, partial [Chloroflexota bacterium]
LAGRLLERALTIDPAEEAAHRAVIEMHLEAGHVHAARRQLLACRRALAEAYGVEPAPELAALIDAAAARRPSAPVQVATEPEIIGRRIELDHADPALDAVAGGRLGALLLRGAPGIGKSRLLREVVRSATASEWRLLELRGLELSADTAFGSIGRAIAASVDAGTVAAWPEPGRSAVLTIAPSLRSGPAGGADGDAQAPVLGFATDAGLRAGLVEGLRQLGSARPLVIAVDDLQWLDRSTIALLDSMLAQDSAPVLLLLTLRDERGTLDDPGLKAFVDRIEGGGFSVMRLGPLARREIGLLLERELGGATLADNVSGAIADLAGGTPLYALQLLREAQETGAIGLRDGEWRFSGSAAALPVPVGVRKVVEERSRRLSPDVQAILGVAAELGDEVSYQLLVAAAGADGVAVFEALDAGLALDLLREERSGYRFAHPLFRAALRRDLPRRSRVQLHGRIAAALARGLDPADEPGLAAAIASGTDAVAVASHAAEAVDLGGTDALPLAVGFGFAAGARQFALFDHAGAAATLRRALGLWYRLPPGERRAFRASGAQHRLGLALKAIGDHAAASEAFSAEIATAADDMERARGHSALAWLPYEHGRFDRSESLLQNGIASVSEPVARAFLESGLGWIKGRQGEWAAAHSLLANAVAVLEPVAPPDILARALDRFAVSIRDTGSARGAVPVFERALAAAIESGSAHEEAMVRMHLAGALREVAEIAGAREQLERSLTICGLTGDRYIEAVSLWVLAEVEDAAGRLGEAIELRRRELSVLHGLGGNPQNQALAHAHIAHLAARLGDAALHASAAQEARTVAGHAGLDYLPALVDRAIGATDFSAVAHRHQEVVRETLDGLDPPPTFAPPGA